MIGFITFRLITQFRTNPYPDPGNDALASRLGNEALRRLGRGEVEGLSGSTGASRMLFQKSLL